MSFAFGRRAFLAGAAALAAGRRLSLAAAVEQKVVLIQYGGCVRRRETIEDEATTLSPFLFHKLLPKGTLYSRAVNREVTGHASGSLYLFTGKYGEYPEMPFNPPRMPLDPTLGEYLRRHLGLAEEQVLVVHNEQRDSEFLWASREAGYGPEYRPGLLSIYRTKARLLARDVAETRAKVAAGKLHEKFLDQALKAEKAHLAFCYRAPEEKYLTDCPAISRFLDRYLAHYEPPGARTREDLAPAGEWEALFNLYDRLLPQGDPGWTVTALRALQELKPRFLSVIYRDVDYVHWGLPYLYQRGIQRMDQGLWEIARYLEQDPYYAGSTTLIVVPEGGRGTSPYKPLPFQHHDPEDAGSHEVFIFAMGPGIAQGRRVDVAADTIDVVPTIGRILRCPTPRASGKILGDLFG